MSQGSQHPAGQAGAPTRTAATRHGLIVSLCLFGLMAMLAMVPTAGAAEGECPNEAIRIEQGSTHLPDCRAWELVSMSDKELNQISYASPISTDGTATIYQVFGNYPGSSGVSRATLRAERSETGWVSTDALVPSSAQFGDTHFVGATSPDRSSFVASVFDGALGQAGNATGESLVRVEPGPTQTLLRSFPLFWGSSGIELVASDDLSRVYARVRQNPDPGVLLDGQIYDFGADPATLVSLMPGTNLPPACGVDQAGFVSTPGGTNTVVQRFISRDGSRVFFASRGDSPGCAGPLRLFMRDVVVGVTTELTGAPVGSDPDNGINAFLQATPDGSAVFYRTATSYDLADDSDVATNPGTVNDMDIYRWRDGAGTDCTTCVVPAATLLTGHKRVAISEDGSHVYFNTTRVLADAPPGTPAAVAASPHLYVWHDGEIHYIARTNGVGLRPAQDGTQVTPDGNVLVFWSTRPELNALTGSENGGMPQYYRYDDRDESLVCISCPPPGTPPNTVSPTLIFNGDAVKADAKAVTNDGSMVFFSSLTKLVPEDVNGDWDLYEWHDGEVGLLSDGRTRYATEGGAFLYSASPDGRDVLFNDQARLTHDAGDDAQKLYDARIDGGFPAPPPGPAACSGEGCMPRPSPQPGALGSGSDAIVSAGNLPSRRPAVRCKASQRRVVTRGGKTRCVRKPKKTSQGKKRTARTNRRVGR